ncbi:hypothetical protein PLESTM_001543000 [Pleodorina starrii]|nr:hypothetical protein PLESTM_001543000 [Pleodorina starrii]
MDTAVKSRRFNTLWEAVRGHPNDIDCSPADYRNRCYSLFRSVYATLVLQNGNVTVADGMTPRTRPLHA